MLVCLIPVVLTIWIKIYNGVKLLMLICLFKIGDAGWSVYSGLES